MPPRIGPGDSAPLFNLPNTDEESVILRDNAGRPILLFFYASDELPACKEIALAYRDLLPTLASWNIQIMGISSDSPAARKAFAEANNLPFTLLCDTENIISRRYGACAQTQNEDGTSSLSYMRLAFLLDPNLRVIRVYHIVDLNAHIRSLTDDVRTFLAQEEPRHVQSQAPVLIIPRAMSPAFCLELIEVWHTQGNEDSGFMKRDGDKTVGVFDYGFKVRRDHFVKDEKLRERLDWIMLNRVFPQIKQAFQYEASRREDYKIACYEADKGGFFRMHRDNTSGGTSHRRWAMTLNLNAEEHEGGYLRFPEYTPHLYKPSTGDAVIFSCSIMHEATPVTLGNRFALLAFFYGEQEAQQRLAYEQQYGTDYFGQAASSTSGQQTTLSEGG